MKSMDTAPRNGARMLLVYPDRMVTGAWDRREAYKRLDGTIALRASSTKGFWNPDDVSRVGALDAYLHAPEGWYPLPERAVPIEDALSADYERGVAAGGG